MNLKKKKTIITTSIITGVCILAGSAFANYSTANGYDVFKTGVKNMVGMKNYTFDAIVKMNADGVEVWDSINTEKYDSNGGNPMLSQVEKTISKDGEDHYFRIIRDGKRYYPVSGWESEPTSWEALPNYDDNPGTLDMISNDEKNTADKVIRFVELLSDTVVGDLKNNFVYGGESEYGGAKYSIALDKIQIPELINAGISAVCALNSYDLDEESYYYGNLEPSDPDYYMYHNSSITSVSCNFETDTEGRLADTVMTVNVASEDGHTIEMIFEIKLYDIGSTVPDDIGENASVEDRTSEFEPKETVEITLED